MLQQCNWCCFFFIFLQSFLLVHGALLPWGPGRALSVNALSNTEYAYSYPRRLARAFTIEFWARGDCTSASAVSSLSIAHPQDDNAVLFSKSLYVLGVYITDTPNCPSLVWCHYAVSVDVTAYPKYDIRYYLNGSQVSNKSDTFTKGLNASCLEDESLSIVLGAEQDQVLGAWDSSQIFSGHFDEFRIWHSVRGAAEIRASYKISLPRPYPADLASYYTFDSDETGPPFYEDQAGNGSNPNRRLYVADYSNSSTAPTLSPEYSPPEVAIPSSAVSTAPVFSTSGNAFIRVQTGAKVSLSPSDLFSGATGTATLMINNVTGGQLKQLGNPAVGNVDMSQALVFSPYDGELVPEAGFTFTVTDRSGGLSVSSNVRALANSFPVVSSTLALHGDEDSVVSSWITANDANHDIVYVEIVQPPTTGSGTAEVDVNVRRSVRFTPAKDLNGPNIATFVVRVQDTWGGVSGLMQITVSLKPVQDVPQLELQANYTIFRGQSLDIPFTVIDVDGNDPFVVVTDWPSPTQGVLMAKEGARQWTIDECSISSKMQWASNFSGFSSHYADSPYASYGIGQIIGKPQTSEYADSEAAWCPATIDGSCKNRATPAEAESHFYTEFVEAVFQTPMFLTDVIVVENYGGDRVSRILVPSDRDSKKWKTIQHRYLPDLPASPKVQQYSIYSQPVCQVVWPADRVRIEIDTCHRSGWYEIDAVQVRGGVLPPTNILNTTTQLSFLAAPGYTGNVTFGLTATSCYGSFDATSEPQSITISVIDTPHILKLTAHDHWISVDVGTLESSARSGNVQVLELPSRGTLRYNGYLVNATRHDLGSKSTIFEYLIYRCDNSEEDAFIVQLGPKAVVQVNIKGCEQTSFLVVAIVVPIVVTAFIVAVVFFICWYQKREGRDNSYAPKDSQKPICVMFTDIQASTMLWGEIPELMSAALDTHHAIIRKLIKKHKCYEVKTIGDSFMVATADPVAALQLALSIQDSFYDHDWESDDIDDVYRRQTDCHLLLSKYRELWYGLRVRVGMHYGKPSIIFDEVTKGYDYYGTLVNAAARIEGAAHGGQVLMSSECFEQVSTLLSHPSYVVATKQLGSHQLRGLPSSLDLVQVLPTRFAERQFPELRIDHGGDDEEEDVEAGQSDAATTVVGSVRHVQYPQAMERELVLHPLVRSGTMSLDAAVSLSYNLFYAIKSMINMNKGDAKDKRLKEWCKQWHIPCQVTDDRHKAKAMAKLAMQIMGSVVNQSQTKPRAMSCHSRITETEPTPKNAILVSRQPLNRVVPAP